MLPEKKVICPDCEEVPEGIALDRRGFLRGAAVATDATATGTLGLLTVPGAQASPTPRSAAETSVKILYDKLTDKQKQVVCFDWDDIDKDRGLLRTHVSNNWHITKPTIDSNFFTKEQRAIILDIFK